jgi:hypothetical protein
LLCAIQRNKQGAYEMFVSHATAVNAYNAERVRLPVELSPAARAYNARNPRPTPTCAGLAEVQAEADFRPMPAFLLASMGTTNEELLRNARVFARKVQEAKELRARLQAEQVIHN